jgi:hypothetical protein
VWYCFHWCCRVVDGIASSQGFPRWMCRAFVLSWIGLALVFSSFHELKEAREKNDIFVLTTIPRPQDPGAYRRHPPRPRRLEVGCLDGLFGKISFSFV